MPFLNSGMKSGIFFETSNIKRAYTADFEKYISHDKIETYISVL